MTDTSDFDLWLSENEPAGYEDIYNLYRAVVDRESMGMWQVSTKGDKTFVKGPEGTLQLLSEDARKAFLPRVEHLNDSDMSMDGWYEYHRAMAKKD